MTKPQKDVILIGLIVIAVMALFPPWKNDSGISVGYWPIFYAPNYYGGSLDLARLTAQVLLVAAVCAALYLYRKQDS